MHSRLYNLIARLLTITLCVVFISCQDQIPARSLVTSGSTATTSGSGDGTTTVVKRPTGAIAFKADFCACKDQKAVSYGNCGTFCSTKSTAGAEKLYANFTVTEAITLSGLGNVSAWCNTLLPADTANPICVLEAKDSTGTKVNLPVVAPAGTNSITAEIQSLSNDKTYVFTLIETTSGAKSDSVQMIKYSSDVITSLGFLKQAPISQYTCLVRQTASDATDIYYNQAYRLHFYFLPAIAPNPIPAGTTNLICHDFLNPLYGRNDSELYPRLEQIPGVFNLWDTSDPRFFDNNGNSIMDVNEVIAQKTKNFGGSIPSGTNFFVKFSWPGAPTLSTDAGNTATTVQPIGYYMAPWIDQTTYKSYCLTSAQYESSNPLFQALRDTIEVDTEGLYIGEKAAEVISTGTTTVAGPKDYILIRETDLKKVWFYMNNGTPTAPTDANVASVAVYFYYPINPTTPFVKSSTQRIYRVRSAAELAALSTTATGTSGSTGTNTSYPPHDRKIGCVPKF